MTSPSSVIGKRLPTATRRGTSAGCATAGSWRTDAQVCLDSRVAGFDSPTLLRKHLHATVGLSPGAHRRTFTAPGARPPVPSGAGAAQP
jgi:hypothetical protein